MGENTVMHAMAYPLRIYFVIAALLVGPASAVARISPVDPAADPPAKHAASKPSHAALSRPRHVAPPSPVPVAVIVLAVATSETDSLLGGAYRFYGFPPGRPCDDGGAGNGRCLTVIRIGHLVVGEQDWYIRWTSEATAPLAYRAVSANDPWHTTHVTCAPYAAGLRCTTVYPQVFARYGLKVIRQFTLNPDGTVRLDNLGDGSSADPGPSYGAVINDIATVTTLPLPP
jgi:hypothetical protein